MDQQVIGDVPATGQLTSDETFAALQKLYANAQAAGLPWRPPRCWEEVAEFFGCGGQGHEKARMLISFDDGHVWSSTTIDPDLGEELVDHLKTYRRYLEANGWL